MTGKERLTMKTQEIGFDRDDHQKTYYTGGDYTYEYIADYAKGIPAAIAGAVVAGGCTDPDNNLYLAMRANPSRIVMLDPEGNFVKEFGQEYFGDYIHFIYYTPQKTLLCADSMHHVIREITTDGKLVRDFGNYDHPSDTGMDLGYYKRTRKTQLFPTEPYMGCPPMWMMYEAFRQVKRVGEPFNQPTDAAMNSKGEYFFADGYGNRAVHKFDKDGNYIATYGGVGDYNNISEHTPGKFLVVHALAIDEKDHIWVCDREKGVVHVLDEEGNVVGYFYGNMGQPSGVDSDGKYIYVVGRGGYLTIFDSDMNVVAEIGTFNSDLRSHDCAVDGRGNLFLFPTHATEDHQVICLKRIKK